MYGPKKPIALRIVIQEKRIPNKMKLADKREHLARCFAHQDPFRQLPPYQVQSSAPAMFRQGESLFEDSHAYTFTSSGDNLLVLTP